METVTDRLDIYEEQTKPLISYYRKKKILKKVDGTKAINEIFKDIVKILDEDK